MPASADQLSSAKVLIFVALFALSSTSVVSAGSMLPDGTRTLNASDVMDTTHALVSRQRFLESTHVATTATYRSNEERAPPDLSAFVEGSAFDVYSHIIRLEGADDLNDGFSHRFSGATNDKFLENPLFREWVDHVTSRFEGKRDGKRRAQFLILAILAKHLKEKLVTTLVAATKVDTTTSLAANTLLCLAGVWAKEKKTPEEVFTALEIHEPNVNPFDNPIIALWEKFVRHVEPITTYPTMFKILQQNYAEAELVHFLVEGAEKKGTRGGIASNVLDAQLDIWAKDRTMIGEKVFDLLELNTIQDQLGQSPVFDKWYKYLGRVLGRASTIHFTQEQLYATMLVVVEHRCTEKNLVSVCAYGAKKKETRGVAENMLKTLVNKWVEDRTMDEEKVYNLLGIRETQDTVEQSSLLSSLYSFAKARYPITFSEKISAVEARLDKLENSSHKRKRQEGPSLKDD